MALCENAKPYKDAKRGAFPPEQNDSSEQNSDAALVDKAIPGDRVNLSDRVNPVNKRDWANELSFVAGTNNVIGFILDTKSASYRISGFAQ